MGNRLYVGNLSSDVTTETVREWFATCGTVTDVHVVTNRETGHSRGFAFVTMSTDAEAQKAIAETNGALMDGRPLRVNEAEARPIRGGGGRRDGDDDDRGSARSGRGKASRGGFGRRGGGPRRW